LLAFAIPFDKGDEKSPSYRLQRWLHKPVAFIILPLFALANTAILISSSVLSGLVSPNSYGIIFGLLIGKPLGIFLFSTIGAAIGWCSIPATIKKSHLLWSGFVAGIGFTMSIFITLLAFSENNVVNESKIAIMVGSLIAGTIGYIGLKLTLKPQALNVYKPE
jgi:NhaA family Na+:H+ antiporter